MNKIQVAVVIFLVIGSAIIYQQTSESNGSFPKALWTWTKQLGSNLLSVTGFAVKEHKWLPNGTEDNTDGN